MADDLESLRREIDAADDKILDALNARFALAARMRDYKKTHNLPAVDKAREDAIMKRVIALAPAAERDTVYGVYERIFSGSRGVIETVARGVAIRDGKILLCHAKGGSSSYLPGGHIEFGETAKDALAREIAEELGVAADVGDFLGVVENSFTQAGKPHAEINLVYRVRVDGFPTTSREDWITFSWCPLDALDKADLLPRAMIPLCRAE